MNGKLRNSSEQRARSMTGTPMIHDLVREGRVTPKQGARLIELRRDLAQRRERKKSPERRIMRFFVWAVTLGLSMFGVRNSQGPHA